MTKTSYLPCGYADPTNVLIIAHTNTEVQEAARFTESDLNATLTFKDGVDHGYVVSAYFEVVYPTEVSQ